MQIYITALCLIEPEVLHCGNRNLWPFVSMWPWYWPDDLHIRTWPVYSAWYAACTNINFLHQDFRYRSRDQNYKPRRFAGGQQASRPGIQVVAGRDSNTGPVFTIPGFGIDKFLIPGSRRDYAVGRYFSKLDKSTKVDETKSAAGPGPDNIHAAFIHRVTDLFVSKLFICFIFVLLCPYDAFHRATTVK